MTAVRKSWRDAASLILLTKRNVEVVSCASDRAAINYDILLQTRTNSGSFANSVVFPGGVCEPADGDDRWPQLLKSFGYSQSDFETLHSARAAPTLIFQTNPILRHIQLRITAIRETFEELGLLLCCQKHKKDRTGIWADIIFDVDVKLWQDRISKNPEELWNLCKEHNCYPDIWSLHYWSNWLTPINFPKRFNTAFFVTGLESKPTNVKGNTEVKSVEWLNPAEVLSNTDIILYPPQVYELNRLSHVKDITELICFAKSRSCHSDEFIYPFRLKLKDGALHLLPGDELYPSSIDYNDNNINYIDKTIFELREKSKIIHRVEIKSKENKDIQFILKNYKPKNHIDMGDRILSVSKF